MAKCEFHLQANRKYEQTFCVRKVNHLEKENEEKISKKILLVSLTDFVLTRKNKYISLMFKYQVSKFLN